MNDTYTLWKILKDYIVIIPMIQRDYAQGREDKKFIRRTFLNQIKECLNTYNADDINKASLSLDFVYGNVQIIKQEKCFYPLDGQQRLTTLWLIHWYVALRSGKLEEKEIKESLKRFSYEIRSSSKDFCEALCDRASCLKDSNNLINAIKSQTWFYSSWLKDPTISAMLRTIGGDGESIDDNIVGVFNDVDYEYYWEMLTVNSAVTFELMVIGTEKLPVSDDLYIKMNARGKPLTNFENLKADLVSWIQSDDNPNKERYSEIVPKKNEYENQAFEYKHYFPAQIDNTWTDVFWNSAKNNLKDSFNGKIDEAFFAFINRFVLNEICIKSEMNTDEFAQGKEKKEHKDEKNIFNHLSGTKLSDDTVVQYEGFGYYEDYLSFENLKLLDRVFGLLNNQNNNVSDTIKDTLSFKSVDESDDSSVDQESSYTFIPVYSDDNNRLIKTTQKERVYFLAICLFIGNTKNDEHFDISKFKRWMRVVKNLTENADIRGYPAMVTCMRRIRDLSEEMSECGNDIYAVLNSFPDQFSDSKLEQQLKEEKEKAKKIHENPSMESIICDAEKHAFFNGSIRFLYRNAEGIVDWGDFETKFKKSKELFNSEDVSLNTIKAFLSFFDNFSEICNKHLFTTSGSNHRKKNWKDILCDNNLQKQVHCLFSGCENTSHDNGYNHFLNSGLINAIIDKSENYKFRIKGNWYNNTPFWEIHRKGSWGDGVYVYPSRVEKYKYLKDRADENTIIIDAENSYHGGYYWGEKIKFTYKNKEYVWYEEKGKEKIRQVKGDNESAYNLIWDNTNTDLIKAIDNVADWNSENGGLS